MNNQGGGEILAPWDPMNMNPNNMDPTQAASWRERERRQRTIRLLMMFLLMLLLMDSEDQAGRKRNEPKHRKGHHRTYLSNAVFGSRMAQETKLLDLTQKHPRYKELLDLNNGKSVPVEVQRWAVQQAEVVKDEFVVVAKETQEPKKDPEEDRKVFHYPWNATGFYRGEWTRDAANDAEREGEDGEKISKEDGVKAAETAVQRKMERKSEGSEAGGGSTGADAFPTKYVDALTLESEMIQDRKDRLGIFLLPPGKEVILRYDQSNFTSYDWDRYSSELPLKYKNYYMRTDGDNDLAAKDGTSNRNKDEYAGDSPTLVGGAANPSTKTSKVTLTKGSGRAAFQLFSRSIPGMQEISLVDGFLKLYDSNMPGYSTHKDILLRVRGVLIHGIGRMSLVSNAGPGRSVLVLGDETVVDVENEENDDLGQSDLLDLHRRLTDTLAELNEAPVNPELSIKQVREHALTLYGSSEDTDGNGGTQGKDGIQFRFESLVDEETLDNAVESSDDSAKEGNKEAFEGSDEEDGATPQQKIIAQRRTRVVSEKAGGDEDEADHPYPELDANDIRHLSGGTNAEDEDESVSKLGKYTWSDVVIPYPFVLDDEEETIRKTKTPAARKMPPREQLLERNAGTCEFEVTMDTKEVEWTVGEWRKLVGRRVKESMDLNPSNQRLQAETEDSVEETRNSQKRHRISYGSASSKSSKSSRERQNRKPIQDQALIMKMTGSIHSPNCDFTAHLNVTALRTDWEHTTGKAINYSFYMMLTCLTQIMVLLRQLLHTQAQSAATRVSLLCIGWQTVLDALLCLGHIYLSLAMQPLFTAFASVAFFKLLIFCVIEMKYMALIIQARNSSNGGNTTELLRRQVAMLHLRFYVALFGAFLAFFYAGEKFRIPYNLALYSFWVPQIVQNVITEAKRPMHNYYIYGMSLTRLVAPLYVFGESNNFLKEVYPESPTDLYMCELLVLWIGIQTAVLIAQGKYGARFMIPSRFLPPKFDYSRPIPPSMLPPGTTQEPTPDLPLQRQGRNSESSQGMQESQSLLSNDPVAVDRHTTGVTTRNRIKGSRGRQENSMTTETVVNDTSAESSAHSLDCVICYNAIDVHNRRGYMLAPCDHIFHRDCLLEWMNVKMECPICRTELPSI